MAFRAKQWRKKPAEEDLTMDWEDRDASAEPLGAVIGRFLSRLDWHCSRHVGLTTHDPVESDVSCFDREPASHRVGDGAMAG